MRANHPYAEVDPKSAKHSENGSMLGKAKNKLLKGVVFETIDEFKGDLARGYFYLLTAYYDKIQDCIYKPIYRVYVK
jgi:endonuclease I